MKKNENSIPNEVQESKNANEGVIIVSKTDIIEPTQLQQSELIQNLQTFLFEISIENINLTLINITESVFSTSIERIEQLARNIFFAARFRYMKIELLSNLVFGLVQNASKEKPLDKLPEILMRHFFTKAFHDEYSYKETWRFFFLYQLLKRGIYLEDDIINEIRKFYTKYKINKNEDHVGLFKIMCAWFAPEIERKAPDLYSFFSFHDSFSEEEQNKKNSEQNEQENEIFSSDDQNDDDIYKETENNQSQSNEAFNRNSEAEIKTDPNPNQEKNSELTDSINLSNIKKKHQQDIDEEIEIENKSNDHFQFKNNNEINESESESDPLFFIFESNGENETRVFDVLHNQGYSLDFLRANDWSFYRRCRDIGYTVDPLVECLLKDDDDGLQKLSIDPNFDIETMIEPSLFSRSTILQDSTSPIYFAAAVSAVKCFRFLLLNNANLEYETWNEQPTTIASFAVAGGSNEIVRLLKQNGSNFNEALFVAVQYHRSDIFNWLFQLLNADIEVKSVRYGTLLHRAAKSNNVELSLFCMEHNCDVNKPVANRFFN